jgi:carboxyl-terminal processing protease
MRYRTCNMSGCLRVASVFFIALMSATVAAGGQTGGLTWTDSDSMRLFYEALTTIQANALDPDPPLAVVRTSLREYLKKADPFSDYLTPEEYTVFSISATDARYSGVGMDIGGDASGKIICIPYPGGSAEQAGIAYGDELVALNGAAVAGQSTTQVGLKIRGKAGTPVRFTLQGRGPMLRTVTVVRAQVRLQSVFTVPRGPFSVIKILKFTQDTPRELKEALVSASGASDNADIRVIDLTGNKGGDLYAAVACAALFIPESSPVLTVKTREGVKRHTAGTAPADLRSRLFLWQDAQTASAAEVFIAALVQNDRSVSIGETSFGKGVAQRVIELMDRSALVLTYAELLPPNGRSFHGIGLAPLFALPPRKAAGPRTTDAYVSKTRQLIRRNP